MEKTTFNEITAFLKHGREIEFSYKNKLYSITTSHGYWNFCCGETLIEQICPFDDKQTLVERAAAYSIEGIPIPVIFDHEKYDAHSVCIL